MSQLTSPQYDFYATPDRGAAPGATPAPAAPVFGGGGAVNQFGTPLGAAGAAYAVAAALPAVTSSRGVRLPGWAWRWLAGLGVAVVLGLFGVGRLASLDLTVPDAELPAVLAGQPATTTSESDPEAAEALFGEDMTGMAWARYSGERTLLVSVIPFEVPDAELAADMGDGFGAATATGTAWCSTHPQTGWSWCARSVDGRTVEAQEASTDTAALAAVVEEAVTSLR